MCIVLLPPGDNPIAGNKYIIYQLDKCKLSSLRASWCCFCFFLVYQALCSQYFVFYRKYLRKACLGVDVCTFQY